MMQSKAIVILIAGGLMGSGIVAVTRSGNAAVPRAALESADSSDESFQKAYVYARFAAQRPFAMLTRGVSR